MRRLCVTTVLGCALLSLTGCSRPMPAAPVPAPPGNAPAAEPSALAIKRGMFTLTPAGAVFMPCGESVGLRVVDQTDAVLARAFTGESPDEPLELYLEAYGERAEADDATLTAGLAGMFMLEEVLYAGFAGEGGGCRDDLPDYIVMARGNEPFWAVEVNEDTLVWRQPDEPQELILKDLSQEDAEGAVRYQARNEDHALELLLTAQPCIDSMSGEFFAYAASARLDDRTVTGCARVGR